MIFQFQMALKKQPRKGDWYSEIQNILEEFELNMSEEEIKRTPVKCFKKMVKNSSSTTGRKYLKLMQSKGTKGIIINYDSLEAKDYLII